MCLPSALGLLLDEKDFSPQKAGCLTIGVV
jgi:hypothetical protein